MNPTEWLRANKKEVSPFGERVAHIVGDLYGGIYHLQSEVLKADWSHPQHVHLVVQDFNFATYDSGKLTQLVVLAHKHNVRVSIKAAAYRYLRLEFVEVTKNGFFRDSHPGLDELIDIAQTQKLMPDITAGKAGHNDHA